MVVSVAQAFILNHMHKIEICVVNIRGRRHTQAFVRNALTQTQTFCGLAHDRQSWNNLLAGQSCVRRWREAFAAKRTKDDEVTTHTENLFYLSIAKRKLQKLVLYRYNFQKPFFN
jgi:hypothetical protein